MRKSNLAIPLLTLALAVLGCTASSEDSQPSSLESDEAASTNQCTFTQGYWKNHPGAWPVQSLTLGSKSYTKAQLLAIFGQPVKGNGLVSLAHQLIAAKLNVAAGAPSGAIASTISSADAKIGGLVVPPVGSGYLAPSSTSSLTGKLDAFNNGDIGPGHCGDTPPGPVCGNGIKETGEECDDGNDWGGDGCSPTCTIEPPFCSNGVVEAGEQCDDGNTTNGDGCSSTCQCEPPPPVCGNGIKETGEECDDGNTVDGDGCSSTCQCTCPT